jgi:hypothetical protein
MWNKSCNVEFYGGKINGQILLQLENISQLLVQYISKPNLFICLQYTSSIEQFILRRRHFKAHMIKMSFKHHL